jgi:hypothetical protein
MKRKFLKDCSRITLIALELAIFSAALPNFGALAAPETANRETILTPPQASKVGSPIVPNLTVSQFETTSNFGFWLGGITKLSGGDANGIGDNVTLFKNTFPTMKGVIIILE